MASTAPAAPSTSAPATSAGQPAPGTADLTAGAPTATAVPSPEAPRLAKPVKPIPDLPGVFADDDPFPLPPSRSATSDPSKGTGPVRGPDGRYLAGTSPAADSSEHAPEAGTQPDPNAPQSAKFKFAGEEYDSREAAEQNIRSLRGQFRPIQSLARSLGGVDKIIPQFTSAAESARGWKAEATRLAAELEAARNGAPVAGDTPTAPVETAEAVGIDWELYAEVRKLATERGEPWKAEQWLHERQEEVIQARIQRALDERFAPIDEADQSEAVTNQTAELFGSLAQYVNSDGSAAYPELGDEQASYAIGKIWATMGLPPEAALTPQGAIAAIGLYRMAKSGRAPASPASTVPPATTAAPPYPTDAHAAADLGDGRQRVMSMPGGDGTSAEASRILAGLRSVNSGNRALLGFEA